MFIECSTENKWRRYASAVYAMVLCLSVCLLVCPSQVGVLKTVEHNGGAKYTWGIGKIDTVEKLGIERLQALADISRSRYVAVATQPVHRLQIRPIVQTTRGHPLPFPKLHPGPSSSVGLRLQTDTQTRRRAWPIYRSRRVYDSCEM